jgi:hypothetical protein
VARAEGDSGPGEAEGDGEDGDGEAGPPPQNPRPPNMGSGGGPKTIQAERRRGLTPKREVGIHP